MTAVAIEVHELLDSTNAEARRRASAGLFQDLWIFARRQSGGRGRRGRAWISEEGNIFGTRLIDPKCAPRHVAELSFVAALATHKAVVAAMPDQADRITCKWPNDVLVGGRKVSGMLLEGEGGSPVVAVGIGINVTHFPDGTETPATSIAAEGGQADVELVRQALVAGFEHWLAVWREEGFQSIRQAWLERASGYGQRIRVRLEAREFFGKFSDLDTDGALIVTTDDGIIERVAAGDVFLL